MLTTVVPTFVLMLIAAVSLSEATCVESEDHCVTCHTSIDSCYVCEDGYYPWYSVCEPCLEACVTCTRGNGCSLCKTGKWGRPCNQTCPVNCRNNRCNQTTGECSEGCDVGFDGSQCLTCENGGWGSTCSELCPVNCRNNRCDQTTGDCSEGCSNGYHGSSCNITCPVNCRNNRCDQTTGDCSEGCDVGFDGSQCMACETGRWGSSCDNTCPENCRNDTCNQSTGVCSNGCDDGQECNSTCGTSCVACSDGNTCTLCRTGLWGQNCDNNCPTNCNTSTCAITGDCSDGCVNGRYGAACNETCPSNCFNDMCDQTEGDCSQGCVTGYYGSTCLTPCPVNCKNDICNQTSGDCSEGCDDSFTGLNCSMCTDGRKSLPCQNNTCPVNCKNNICDQSSWKCSDGCNDGYRGSTCIETCPVNCKNDRCDQSSGDCSDGCNDGYHGSTCQETCPVNCKNRICDQSSGDCSDGCNDGYRGSTCQETCPVNCKNRICNQSSGDCSDGCNDGYHGSTCQETCPVNCKNRICDQSSGDCSDGCNDGYRGSTCQETCPVNCKNRICDQSSEDCSDGCNDGYRGSTCQETCPVNCKNDRCNQSSGECNDGCDDGRRGSTCKATCPVNCKNDTCDQSSGVCSDGCDDGYYGSKCNDSCFKACLTCYNRTPCTACGIGKYGLRCDQDCSEQCVTCDQISGNCTSCQNGFSGPLCEARLTTDEAIPMGGVVGGVLALLGVIVAAVIVLVLLRRRRRQRNKHDSPDNVYVNGAMSSGEMHQKHISAGHSSVVWSANPDYGNFPALTRPATVLIAEEEEEETAIVNQSSDPEVEPLPEPEAGALPASEVVVGKPIRLDNLQKFVREKSNEDYAEEFEKLPQGLLKPHAASRRSENLHKNRYKLLYPYDDNRVVLKAAVGDYINASYIDGYSTPRAYIAALGPTHVTLDDFWEMIWQEEVGTIVMLTRLFENASGKIKCEQYWPDKRQSVKHGSISVTMETEEEFADFVVRELIAVKDGETRTIRHIQYTSWPDHGVPDDVTSLVEFRQKVKATQSTLSGPTVVHCSAGIGRTGTYIALDYLSEEGEAVGAVNIAGCVRRLREQRVNMVQTEAQYGCLHHAVVHSLTLGCENIPGDKFRSNYITVTRPVTGGAPLLRQKFQQLQEILETTPGEDDSVARNTAFKKKNRKGNPVPGNGHRPFLHLDVSKESSNYINAVFLNSYLSRNALIVTQTPLPATVEDFWTLVVQENSPCIVMMETLDTSDKDIGVYMPPEGVSRKFGKFTIQLTKTEENDTFVTNTLKVVHKGNEREVTQFRFLGWALGDKVPESPSSVLQLIGAVEGAARASDCKGPVIVHCLDGAERSGLYCAVFVLTEKMKLEQEVSVINTVRQMKTRRRQIVPNYEQYCYCHLAVNTLLESFKTYSNFVLR